MVIRFHLSILLLVVACKLYSQQNGSFKDVRDNRVYKTVQIGHQEWMAENLNTTKFENGNTIPQAKSKEEWLKAGYRKEPVWCFYKFDSSYSKYGKLYNYYALTSPHNLAPDGWRVPTFFDYLSLIVYLEPLYSLEALLEKKNSMAGGYLKSKLSKIWTGENCTELDAKFNALPSGGFSPSIDYTDYDWDSIGEFAGFWCLTNWSDIAQKIAISNYKDKDKLAQEIKREELKEKAIIMRLNNNDCIVDFDEDPMHYGRSVRLVKSSQ
jgi:uncharacterized protein (TIGR02145 family)